uniref:Uncharacterized protein n=1 Tax=Loa loa TaxID=7209 RepID=A0A1I7V9V4_LOALO
MWTHGMPKGAANKHKAAWSGAKQYLRSLNIFLLFSPASSPTSASAEKLGQLLPNENEPTIVAKLFLPRLR